MNHTTSLAQNPIFRAGMLSLAAFTFVLLSSSNAYATFNLCGMVNGLFYANIAPGIATLGVIGIGIAATFGKVTWGMAILVAVGIATIFGAASLITSIGSGAVGC